MPQLHVNHEAEDDDRAQETLPTRVDAMLNNATDPTKIIGQEITPQNIRIKRNAAEKEDETHEIEAAASDETRRAVSVSSQTDTPAVASLTGIEGFSGDANQGSLAGESRSRGGPCFRDPTAPVSTTRAAGSPTACPK